MPLLEYVPLLLLFYKQDRLLDMVFTGGRIPGFTELQGSTYLVIIGIVSTILEVKERNFNATDFMAWDNGFFILCDYIGVSVMSRTDVIIRPTDIYIVFFLLLLLHLFYSSLRVLNRLGPIVRFSLSSFWLLYYPFSWYRSCVLWCTRVWHRALAAGNWVRMDCKLEDARHR